MPQIKLQTNDGELFDIEVKLIECSETIKTMVTMLGVDQNADNVVLLKNVRSEIFYQILEWSQHHLDDPSVYYIENESSELNITEPWDVNFVKKNQNILYEMIMAANYLEIPRLLDLTCQYLADSIKGKTANELREILNIPLEPCVTPREPQSTSED